MERAYVPAPTTDFLELARTPKGKLYRKEILRTGTFAHPNKPGEKLVIDGKFLDTLHKNFEEGVCDIVQVPVVNDKNEHVEDPFRNIGEVVDLEVEEDKVFAIIDARKNADDLGNTLVGASAMMHMDYLDTKSGDKVGPTLLHVAVTNRPYITNLEGFEEIIAASADTPEEAPVVLTAVEGEELMSDKDQLIAALRDEHGIDVEALQAAAEETPEPKDDSEFLAALSNVLTEAGAKPPVDPDTGITIKEVAEAVIEVSQERLELSNKVEKLEEELETERQAKVEAEVDGLIEEGKILPKAREAMVKLARNDPETFAALVPDDAIVSLSESGVTTHDVPNERFEAEVERLSAMADEMTGKKRKE